MKLKVRDPPPIARGMPFTRTALAALAVTLAAAPAAAAAEPVMSTSVTVTVGSTVTAPDPVATAACELSMAPGRAQRVRRFTGRLLCDGRPAAGAIVTGGDTPVAVRADGRIVARATVRRSRVVTFTAAGLTVRIPVRAAR